MPGNPLFRDFGTFGGFWPKSGFFGVFPSHPSWDRKSAPGAKIPDFPGGRNFRNFPEIFPGGKSGFFGPPGRGRPRAGPGLAPDPDLCPDPGPDPRDNADPDWESLRSEGGASGIVGALAPSMSRTSRLRLRARARPHRRHQVRAAWRRQTLTELSVIVYDR